MAGTRLEVVEEWRGRVVEIGEDTFDALLTDLTNPNSVPELEQATIPLRDVPETDSAKLFVGSNFHWTIAYEHSPEGGKKRVSRIVFQELPVLTDADWRSGEVWARKMLRFFNRKKS